AVRRSRLVARWPARRPPRSTTAWPRFSAASPRLVERYMEDLPEAELRCIRDRGVRQVDGDRLRRRSGRLERAVEGGEQLEGRERLGEIGVGAGGQARGDVFRLGAGREHDDFGG